MHQSSLAVDRRRSSAAFGQPDLVPNQLQHLGSLATVGSSGRCNYQRDEEGAAGSSYSLAAEPYTPKAISFEEYRQKARRLSVANEGPASRGDDVNGIYKSSPSTVGGAAMYRRGSVADGLDTSLIRTRRSINSAFDNDMDEAFAAYNEREKRRKSSVWRQGSQTKVEQTNSKLNAIVIAGLIVASLITVIVLSVYFRSRSKSLAG